MSNRPILLDYAQERRNSNEIPFIYDSKQDINVLKSAQGNYPFIDAPLSSVMTRTETRVKRESDDEEYSCLELLTKTEANRERDDEEPSTPILTKTRVDRERVNEPTQTFPELYSKTFADRERDDEDDSTYHQ